jgi:predicted PurR-regulated permease PerM
MASPAAAREIRPATPDPDSPGVVKKTADDQETVSVKVTRPAARTRLTGMQGYALVTLAIIALIGALRAAQGFFVPVVFGIVIALALAPLVRRIERLMPRWIAAAFVVLSLTGVVGFMAYSLSDEAAEAIAGLPEATRTLRQTFRTLSGRGEGIISQLRRAAQELQRTATDSTDRPTTPSGVSAVQVVEPPIDFTNFVWLGSQGVLAFAGSALLVGFLVYFLLASGNVFKLKLVRLSGDRLSQRKVTVQVIDQIGERVAKSMLHLILAGVVVGLSTWGLLTYFGVRYAGLWGLGAGLLNCVPYLGPAVVAAGLLLAGLVQFGDIYTAALVASGSMLITTLEGFLFTPIVFGRSVQLNPVAVFVSFMFWGWLWGIPGMLLALPLLMIIKTIAESIEDLNALSELLSE